MPAEKEIFMLSAYKTNLLVVSQFLNPNVSPVNNSKHRAIFRPLDLSLFLHIYIRIYSTNLNNAQTFFFVMKPTRCTDFTKLFCHETLHVSDSLSVHHQEFIHCTISNGICHTASYLAGPVWNCSSILVLLESCLQTCMTHTIAECTVNKLLMMDRRTGRNM